MRSAIVKIDKMEKDMSSEAGFRFIPIHERNRAERAARRKLEAIPLEKLAALGPDPAKPPPVYPPDVVVRDSIGHLAIVIFMGHPGLYPGTRKERERA